MPQMGPSGSGKTTLLDVLAGRKTAGSVSGSIGFAGRQPTRTFLRRYAGYVEQFGEGFLAPEPSALPRLHAMSHRFPSSIPILVRSVSGPETRRQDFLLLLCRVRRAVW